MFLRLREPLREEAREGAGGDGGTSQTPPKPLTEEDVGKLVNASVNAAVTSQLKRALGPAITDAIGGLKLEDKIKEALAAAKPEPAPGEKPDQNKPDPRLSALEAKYGQLEQQYKAEQEARADAERKGRDAAARSALKAALEPHISGTQLDVAARYLFDAQGIVTFDEDGNPLVKSKRAPIRGMPEEEVLLPIADGIGEWLKSDEAKIFLPPPKVNPGRGGAGAPSLRGAPGRGSDGLPRYDSPATTDDEKVQRALEREEALKARLGLS